MIDNYSAIQKYTCVQVISTMSCSQSDPSNKMPCQLLGTVSFKQWNIRSDLTLSSSVLHFTHLCLQLCHSGHQLFGISGVENLPTGNSGGCPPLTAYACCVGLHYQQGMLWGCWSPLPARVIRRLSTCAASATSTSIWLPAKLCIR